MTNSVTTAIKITPENLRKVIKTVPEINDMFVGDVVDSYLVLRIPQVNKDGSLSKRAPKKFGVFTNEKFVEMFYWIGRPVRREFSECALIALA